MTQPLLQLDEMRRPWIDESVAWFAANKFRFEEFTSDDLHVWLPAPPEKNEWGSLLARLKKARLIRKIGYRVSARKEANCRPVSLWQTV